MVLLKSSNRPLIRSINKPLILGSAGVSGASDFLDGVLNSTCCDLDATIASSFTSGQTWANLVVSPPVGDQADYNFFLGADGDVGTDDPTFNTNVFELDGGDFFASTIVQPGMLATMHQDGNVWWVGMVFSLGSTLANNDFLWTNGTSSGSTDRIIVLTRSNGDLRLDRTEGGVSSISSTFVGVLSTDTTFAMLFSGDTNNDTLRLWLNTTTKATDSPAWGAGLEIGDGVSSIGGNNAGGNNMPNGTTIKHFSCGNAFLDDAEAALWYTHMEARHSVDYTP